MAQLTKQNTNLTKQNTNLVEGKDVLMSEEVTIFLLDCSSSMEDSFDIDDVQEKPNYWDRTSKFKAMKEAAISYANQRLAASQNGAADKAGIITFGHGGARILCEPYTTSFVGMAAKLEHLRCYGGTPMAQAFEKAIEMSENYPTAFLRIVLLSDGAPDWKQDVIEKVKTAYTEYGLVTDTIGIGNKNYADVKTYPYGLDEEFMIYLAEIGGGKYTRCTNAKALTQLFLEIEQERALLLGGGMLLLGESSEI